MTQEVAEILDHKFQGADEHHLWATSLSNGYFVSTIHRSEEGKALDSAIEGLMKKFNVTAADLGRPGELGMEGDYETMVFEYDLGSRLREDTEVAFARYDTLEEAEKGHEEMVERWRRMPGPE